VEQPPKPCFEKRSHQHTIIAFIDKYLVMYDLLFFGCLILQISQDILFHLHSLSSLIVEPLLENA